MCVEANLKTNKKKFVPFNIINEQNHFKKTKKNSKNKKLNFLAMVFKNSINLSKTPLSERYKNRYIFRLLKTLNRLL